MSNCMFSHGAALSDFKFLSITNICNMMHKLVFRTLEY